jgi:hypothetical protein
MVIDAGRIEPPSDVAMRIVRQIPHLAVALDPESAR